VTGYFAGLLSLRFPPGLGHDFVRAAPGLRREAGDFGQWSQPEPFRQVPPGKIGLCLRPMVRSQ
jgi:hypothetical protein